MNVPISTDQTFQARAFDENRALNPWGSRLLAILAVLASLDAIPSRVSQGDEVDFTSQVRPILRERCFACHGSLKQESSLRLDSAKHVLRGGDSGEVVDAKSVDQSELLLRVTDDDESTRMPPEGKPLTADEVDLIRGWIRQGAKIPKDDRAEESPNDHWAFQVPRKVALPKNDINPVDQLLEISRKRAGVVATGNNAAKSILLRRAYLALIGVPPTKAELNQFLNSTQKDAYEKIVEQLLEKPQYGERWGRHWMDVWRYTDWYGLGAQLRNSQKHIWHWRDWIVESLNNDEGYDLMILQMLAADELCPTDNKRLRATGFLARNYYLFNRTTWLDSTLEHTSKAFLGLTVNCAKCHDHKYDPISQEDYYRLRAIFEPHQVRLDPVPGVTDLEKGGIPRVFDAHPEKKTYLHIRGDEKNPDKSNAVQPGVPTFFRYDSFRPVSIDLPPEAYSPALQLFVLNDRLKLVDAEINQRRIDLTSAEELLQKVKNVKATKEAKAKKSTLYSTLSLNQQIKEQMFVDDGFNEFNKSFWKKVNGKWNVKNGKLVQSETGSTSRVVESIANHPRDFLLEVDFEVTGGQKWKSIGIRFDADATHEKTVYLSAFSDSKVQVSYANNGNTTYPTDALAKIPVKTNQIYRLRFAVKNKLINVSVDGKHLVSYHFPIERRAGKLQLMSFDSIAIFDRVRLLELPDQVLLNGSNGGPPMTIEHALRNLDLATSKLEEAKLRKVAMQSAHQARWARETRRENSKQLMEDAAKKRLENQVIKKHIEKLELIIKRTGAGGAKSKQLKDALAKLDQQIETLQKKFENPGIEILSIKASQKAMEGPDEKPESRNQPYPKTSTGRRTAFAKWIVQSNNPLTARVAINQIWMRHFGQPLVDPVIDFGRRARKPEQHELLDWLAVDLMENDWKMKRIHRLIVTSKAFKMASSDSRLNVASDNRYYQVRSPLRMESQVVRDSLLRLSGQLEEKLGGPPIDPKKLEMSNRRSMYFRQSRDHQHRFVGMFDDADILRCYRRQESIIPQQALTLSNSKIAYQAARKIVENYSKSYQKDDEFVCKAFELILCRPPTDKELHTCLDSLNQLKKLSAKKSDGLIRARTGVVMGLVNSNDFITIR